MAVLPERREGHPQNGRLSRVNLLDGLIVLLLLAAVASGWRRGLTWVSLSLAGLAVGIGVGAAVARPLAQRLAAHNPGTQALLGTGIFLAAVLIIQGLATSIGYRVRMAALRTRLARLDSSAGAALAAAGVLVGAWFVGYTFFDSPYTRLDEQIKGSSILRRLDAVFPRPPAFLKQLHQLLHDPNFGSPFAGIAGPDLGPVAIPPGADTPGIRTAAQSVSKVLSAGCGIDAGSAWPMGGDLFVTNAHVVAGGHTVAVETPGSAEQKPATVVRFDPQTDVAVLRVPNSGVAPLVLGTNPGRGTGGAVIGYPGGRTLSVVPAAVRGVISAQGEDIYGNPVPREIEVLTAHVIPGNSGGPLVDDNGHVVGLVFASSTTDPSEGYALSMTQISDDLKAARGLTAGVSTQSCTY